MLRFIIKIISRTAAATNEDVWRVDQVLQSIKRIFALGFLAILVLFGLFYVLSELFPARPPDTSYRLLETHDPTMPFEVKQGKNLIYQVLRQELDEGQVEFCFQRPDSNPLFKSCQYEVVVSQDKQTGYVWVLGGGITTEFTSPNPDVTEYATWHPMYMIVIQVYSSETAQD